MFIVLSSVRVSTSDMFELETSCSLCGHRAWARVHGEGRGDDVGIRPDRHRAQYFAAAAARNDALQKVRGCPCPSCGGHDPQTVRWAQLADERAARRRWWRIWAGPVTLPFALLAAFAFTTLMWLERRGDFLEGFVVSLVMAGLGWLLIPPIAFFALGPRTEAAPRVYDVPPPGVTFLPFSPHRGPR